MLHDFGGLFQRHSHVFYYSRFLACYLAERVAEYSAMVETDGSYYRKFLIVDDVRGVPTSAESRLQDAYIALRLEKSKEHNRRFYLKRRRLKLVERKRLSEFLLRFNRISYDCEILGNELVAQGFSVYKPSLVVAKYGRRIVGADLQTRFLQNRGEIRAYGAFAVRPRNVHVFECPVRLAEKHKEFAHTLDAVVAPRPLDILYPVCCLDIIQKTPPTEASPKKFVVYRQARSEYRIANLGFSSVGTPRPSGT